MDDWTPRTPLPKKKQDLLRTVLGDPNRRRPNVDPRELAKMLQSESATKSSDPAARKISSQCYIHDAYFDWERKNRYLLIRRWAKGGKVLLIVGRGPSFGNESIDDPTIIRNIVAAKKQGYNALVFINLFALLDLKKEAPYDFLNEAIVLEILTAETIKNVDVLAGWGNWEGNPSHDFQRIYATVLYTLSTLDPKTVFCYGTNQNGTPLNVGQGPTTLLPFRIAFHRDFDIEKVHPTPTCGYESLPCEVKDMIISVFERTEREPSTESDSTPAAPVTPVAPVPPTPSDMIEGDPFVRGTYILPLLSLLQTDPDRAWSPSEVMAFFLRKIPSVRLPGLTEKKRVQTAVGNAAFYLERYHNYIQKSNPGTWVWVLTPVGRLADPSLLGHLARRKSDMDHFRREAHWRMIFSLLRNGGSMIRATLMNQVRLGFSVKLSTQDEVRKFSSAFRDGLRYLRGRAVIDPSGDVIRLTSIGVREGLSVDGIPNLPLVRIRESKRAKERQGEVVEVDDRKRVYVLEPPPPDPSLVLAKEVIELRKDLAEARKAFRVFLGATRAAARAFLNAYES